MQYCINCTNFIIIEITEKAVSIARPKPTAPESDSIIPEKIKKTDISSTNQTTPKLLRIIAAKRSHIPPTVTTVDPKETITEEFKEFIPITTNKHVDHEEMPEEKVVAREPIPAEIAKEIKLEELIAPEIKVTEVETSIEDIPKDTADIPEDITDENKIMKEMDGTRETYVACTQKELKEEPQKSIPCKCILPSEPKDPSCLTAKSTIDILCPQKKPEEESPESISCKRELFSNLNKCPCLITEYAKCKNTLENNFYKNNESEQRKNYCTYCHLSTAQCTCAPTQYLKSCLKTDKPRFRSMSPLNINSRYCVNCCKLKERCMNCYRIKDECRKTALYCKWCTMRNNCSRIDKCRCVEST